MTSPAGREDCFRLVALGDSITVGVGDTVGPDAVHGPGWAAHLAAVLGAEAFANLATNGARSSDVAQTQLDTALALRPRLATVLVGGNDVLRSDFDARLTLLDLHRCVSELCRAGTDVVLVKLPVIGLFELSPRLVRRVMRRRVASINAAVEEVAGTALDGSAPGPGGRVVVVDAVQAIAPAGEKAWHVDRVHPSPAGHRRLALAVATALTDLDPVYSPPPITAPADENGVAARLPAAPDPPSVWQRLAWLVKAGLPWCVRRGRDFLPGLLRAVVHDLRAERTFAPGSMMTSLADSGLDPRRRIRRG
ncbi:SGNH/GDSL hydrolase family protein [Promicromonospora panici]|uniref:SGNH/GDSL hydrolase family protein n=1 Tax=Promicromonospora panici TaxID=2219658 RepID=UPI0013E9B639|nr:SGNH/GDSL hydrolase family protein [Promicromonospora panici]